MTAHFMLLRRSRQLCRCTLISFALLAIAQQVAAQQLTGAAKNGPAAMLQRLPIAFEPNVGQTKIEDRFLAHQGAMTASFGPGEVGFGLASGAAPTRLLIKFEAANPRALITGEDPLGGTVNYLRGTDARRWLRGIPTFGRVRYRNLYPGIDVVFYGNGQEIEHDFVVEPGANPARIGLQVNGAQRMKLTRSGDLVFVSQGRQRVEFRKPVAYQETTHGRVQVEVAYRISRQRVSFVIGNYDHSRELIIDPVLVYSTYLANDYSTTSAVATDSQGNTYVTGLTFDTSYPVTAGVLQGACASCTSKPDVFVTKLKADGTGQVYSTFLGGSGYDQPFGLKVDANGDAIVAGLTGSTDFPHNESVDPLLNNTTATYGFVSSLTPDGSGVNFSRVLGAATTSGGSAGAAVYALALDASGNAYVTGTASGANFPVTTGALDAVTPAYPDFTIFATKIQPNGAIAYSAIVGDATPQNAGAGPIGPAAIAVDSTGNAYIYGKAGTLWPITAGAYQNTVPGTQPYAAPFVSKLAADGSHLIYSTYVGNGYQIGGITIGSAGEAVLTGSGAASDYPLTADASFPSSTFSSTYVSWLTILNTSGSALVYSSYLTGGGSIGTSIALDPSGNIWVAGSTPDPRFPLVHPLQSSFGGAPPNSTTSNTGFVLEFDPTAKNILFSTYFGSQTRGTSINGLAVDANGVAHITGSTQDDLYTTPGTFQPTVSPPPPSMTPTWPFAAKIDPSKDSPAVCFTAGTNGVLSFSFVTVGTTSSRTVTITNCGTQALTISGFAVTDLVFSVPSAENQCTAQVAPSATCSLVVQFAPTAAGTSTAALNLTSNSSIPITIIPLSGTGAVPSIQLSSTQLNFDPLLLGQSSSSLSVLVFNTGQAPLQIDLSNTTITGDFSFTSDCGAELYTQQSCAFLVTFTPTATGTRTGALTITSNDPAHPTVAAALSGSSVDSFPVPSISQIDSPTIPTGTGAVYMEVYGTNFFPQSQVSVNGQPQSTEYYSGTWLRATIDPSIRNGLGELTITVGNPAPGGGVSAPVTATVYQVVDVSAQSLVSVPSRNLLYAAVGSSATANANSIVPIDPATGTALTPIRVGNNPSILAPSDDGQYLYVGVRGDQKIQRINLATSTIDRTFAFPPNQVQGFTPMSISDMHVVPGQPDSVVVAVGGMMALYNDSGLVNAIPTAYPPMTINSFAFANSATMYALPFTSGTNPYFNVFTRDSSGIHFSPVTSTNTTSGTGNLVISDGTLLYTVAGQVWNPATRLKSGTFPVSIYNATTDPNLFNLILDSTTHKLFLIGDQDYGSSSSALTVSAYDVQTLSLTGALAFPTVGQPLAHNLTRWGTNGLAFVAPSETTSEAVYITRTSLAGAVAAIPFATAEISPSILAFGNQDLGTSSAAQTITLTNGGTGPLAISAIATTGPFTQSNNCGATLAAAGTCTVSVKFTPTAAGAVNGTLTISDNAAGNPQTVPLSGTGTTPTMSLAAALGGSTSATVVSGQTATYNLVVASTPGISGTVTFTCSGAPTNATCTVAPTSTTLPGGGTATVTVSVRTQASTSAGLRQRSNDNGMLLAMLTMLGAPLAFVGLKRQSKRAGLILIVVVCASASVWTGCGGGGGSTTTTTTTTSQSATTPAGTYKLTVTATVGSNNVSQQLTLIVQ